jgi:ABC-type antimicrobial peptide transport system permease subunit
MALGAPGKNILGLVVKQGMTLVLIGLAFGIGCSFLATRVMARMLFGVGAHDPLTMISVSLILAAVALIACMAPALKATRVDPIVALRDE